MSKEHTALKQRWSSLTAVQRALLARRLDGERNNAETTGAARASIRKELPPRVEVDAEGRQIAVYPASIGQQHLWFLDQLDHAAGAAYHMASGWRLQGRLDRGALLAALDAIVARHEVLRTSFVLLDEQPVQRIAPAEVGFHLIEHDLSGLSGAAQQQRVNELSGSEATERFDLSTGPLIRGQLLRLGPEEHLLLITQHQIISDGWSIGVLFREVAALYGAFSQGQPNPLPALPIQYADYAVWQRQWLQAKVLHEQVGFWRAHLAGAPELLELPKDRARPAVQSYAGGRVGLTLSGQLTAGLRRLSQRHGVTLFMTLLAGFSALLSRLSGQSDVVIGTPVANRQRRELESLLGFFANTLALRVDLEDDPSVTELLAQIRASTLEAYAHQDLPLAQVVEALQPARSLSYNPIFQAMLAFDNAPGERVLSLPGLKVSDFKPPRSSAQFDLNLFLRDDGQSIVGRLEYASDLFDRASIERMSEHLLRLLEAMLADDQQRISQLNLLTPAERQQLLVGFNDTHRAYPSERCVHELFEEQVARTPDAVAVVFEDWQLSYRELNAQANRLAHHLIALGVRPDDRVALCMQRSLEMLVGLLGILKAGVAYVPLDPSYPAERLAYMLSDSTPVAVLTQAVFRSSLPALEVPVVVLDLRDRDSPIAREAEDNPAATALGLASSHLAYVIYTSGSTGLPKGVMVEHRSVVNFLSAMACAPGLSADDVLLAVTTLSFDIATLELYLPLIRGARLVLASRDSTVDAETLSRLIEQHAVTAMQATPATWRLLLSHGWPGSMDLRVLCGGEALPAALSARLAAKVGSLWNLYGPTETTIWSTIAPIDALCSTPIAGIGRPIANTQIYILDGHDQPVPVGVAGEIHIAGAGVARGYLNRPELTAERFVADPFSKTTDARMYKTGDLGRWRSDGNIEFLGRNDFQVKIRGFRVELGEIEARLAACPGVREAVVVAREDQPGDKRLVAFLVARAGTELSAGELRSQLSAVLPEYMIPSAFVTLATFPLTPNGKLDRKALPAPDQTSVVSAAYEAPLGEMEIAIALIWQELLKLERIGRHDNFFELGGHSLLAVRLLSRLRQQFGVEVALREVFAQPTLQGVAQAALIASRSVQPALLPVDRSEPLELSWAQQHLWFLDQLDHAAGAAYHMASGWRLQGRLDRVALQATLDAIVARHGVLRTSFVLVDGRPVQQIASANVGFRLIEHELSGLSAVAQQVRVSELSRSEVAEPFDLSAGLLIRGQLLRLGPEEHLLLITQHHIISDGWSIGVLLREISVLYGAFSQGQPNPLPALAIQYADYAVWQRQWLQDEVLQGQVEFWKSQLSGVPGLLELPTDRPRPPRQSYAGGSVGLTVPPQLTIRLRALSRRHRVTPFMTLLAGWSALLCRLSGQSDLVIGTPVANRPRLEFEPLMGYFANMLALRVRLEDDPSVAELLGQIKASTLEAYAHRDVPFAKVVEALQPSRSLGYNPIFQVVLAFNNAPGERALSLPGLKVSEFETAQSSAKFDLTLSLRDGGQSIEGVLEYASDLFDGASIERMGGHLLSLLEAMLADDQQRISQLNLLTPAERQQVLVRFNDTHRACPSERLIHQLFEEQVDRQPDALAVVFEGRELTYGELNARANQLAHHLIALGIRPDDRVAICMQRSVEMVVGLLGVLKAGGAYVPLDPSYPAQRLAYMLEDSAPVALLAQAGMRGGLPALEVPVLELDLQDRASVIAREAAHNPDAGTLGITSSSLAYVIYTSGSTGLPKGVLVEHRNVLRLVINNYYAPIAATDCVAHVSNPAFDASTWEIWSALLNGAKLLVIPQSVLLDSKRFNRALIDGGVTALWQTVGLFNAYADVVDVAFGRLQYLLVGGDALDPRTVARVLSNRHPPRHLVNGYGPTEATTFACTFEIQSAAPEDCSIPIGRPIANTQIYILDSHGQPVPVGVAGEIYIGGAGVARGYLNRPELTAERFMADPFSSVPQSRMYRTGDLGRWRSDGNIEFLGRNDFQVKIRGFRVELGEIEAQLLRCAGVREAVAVAREDEPGEKRLVAYVIAQTGAELSVAQLRSELSSVLPEYMIPSAFVRLEALPLTPNGKLDRKGLPLPDAAAHVARGYEAPEGETEQRLARIWAELLQLERVGREDNFFELGGHSLTALRLMARVGSVFGVQIGVAALFAAPTLRQLARRVAEPEKPLEPWNLIQLQPLGEKTPIIAINNGMLYYKLSQEIGRDRKFIAVQLFDPLHPKPLPSRSLEQITADYVRLIRAAQPHGPYILMGLCVAGLIAYEAARQLRQAGERVPLVVMADTWSPRYSVRAPFPHAILLSLRRRFNLRRHTLARIRALRFDEFVASTRFATWNRLIRLSAALRLIHEPAEFTALSRQDRWFLPALNSARKNYQAPVATGDVVLLQSNMMPVTPWEDQKMGWSNLVQGQLLHYRLPAWHDFVFRDERAVAKIAAILRPLLNQIDAQERNP